MYEYIYIYLFICLFIYIFIYLYRYRYPWRARQRARLTLICSCWAGSEYVFSPLGSSKQCHGLSDIRFGPGVPFSRALLAVGSDKWALKVTMQATFPFCLGLKNSWKSSHGRSKGPKASRPRSLAPRGWWKPRSGRGCEGLRATWAIGKFPCWFVIL